MNAYVMISSVRSSSIAHGSAVSQNASSSSESSPVDELAVIVAPKQDTFAPTLSFSTLISPRLRLGHSLPRMDLDGSKTFRPFSPLAFSPDGLFLVGIARDVSTESLDEQGKPVASVIAQCHVWSLEKLNKKSVVLDVPNDANIKFNDSCRLPAQVESSELFLRRHLHFFPEPHLMPLDNVDFVVNEPPPTNDSPSFNTMVRVSSQFAPIFWALHPFGSFRALILGNRLFVQGLDPRKYPILVAKELPGFSLLRDGAPADESIAEPVEIERDEWRTRWLARLNKSNEEQAPQATHERNEVRLWWGESCLLILTRQDRVGIVLYRLDVNQPWYKETDLVARFSMPGLDYSPDDIVISPTGRFYTTMAREKVLHRKRRPILVDCLHKAGPQVFASPGRAFAETPSYALGFSPTNQFWIGHAREHLFAPKELWGKHDVWALSIEDTAQFPLGTLLKPESASRGVAIACDTAGKWCAMQSVDQEEVVLEVGLEHWLREPADPKNPLGRLLLTLPPTGFDGPSSSEGSSDQYRPVPSSSRAG